MKQSIKAYIVKQFTSCKEREIKSILDEIDFDYKQIVFQEVELPCEITGDETEINGFNLNLQAQSVWSSMIDIFDRMNDGILTYNEVEETLKLLD